MSISVEYLNFVFMNQNSISIKNVWSTNESHKITLEFLHRIIEWPLNDNLCIFQHHKQETFDRMNERTIQQKKKEHQIQQPKNQIKKSTKKNKWKEKLRAHILSVDIFYT